MTKVSKGEYVKIPKADADRIYSEIGKVRAWMSGFAAARRVPGAVNLGDAIPGEDSLRQIQQLLKGSSHDR